MLMTLILAIGGALGAFVAGSSLLAARRPKVDEFVVTGGGGRRNVAPVAMRDRIERPFSRLADRASRRGARKAGKTLAEELGQAGLTFRTSEWMMIRIGCGVLLFLLGFMRFQGPVQGVVLGVLGYFAPALYLRYRQGARRRAFTRQLVDGVTLLSSSLKAGHSFAQAIDMVAKNGQPPMSEEFDRVVREMNIGGSPEQALQKLVRRVESEDLDLIVTAVLIHQSVGGNLSKILDSISHTLRERIRVRGEVAAITAQARASGWIITVLPLAVGGLLYVIAPNYFRPMTTQLLGWLMLGVCGVMIFIGNLFIRKITRIRV
ncbi:MAG TPA: type II secretion system F family protein [Candidatus Dormibacteraeota bacterium]